MATFKIAPFTLWALLLLLALGSGCSAQSRKARHLAKADKYFASGDLEKAKIEYFVVRKLDPTNALASVRLGRIYLSQGSPLMAVSCLVPARRLAPNDPD